MVKRFMLNSAMMVITMACLLCQHAVWVNAQRINTQRRDRPEALISTKAGFISRIRGHVFLQHGNKEPEPVMPGAQMADGDQLSTAAESRVEALINPQAYLRLDEQTVVRALNTVLTEARFELLQGTVMIEVDKIEKEIVFEIVTPQGAITISKTGVCRISLQPSATRIDVIEGEIALGTRQQVADKTALKFGSGKRIEVRKSEAPVVTALELKSYDEFDRWSFQIAKYGLVRRMEAGVYTLCRGQQSPQLCGVYPDFQLKADEWLLTNRESYVELRINRGVFLRLDQQSKLHAVKTENEDAVFELVQGAAIVATDMFSRMRPFKIVTPQGAFMIERGCIARFDVSSAETTVSVRQGQVRMENLDGSAVKGATEISHGKRLQLTSREASAQRAVGFKTTAFKTDLLDTFDRWSFRVWATGYVSRTEGKVAIERKGGTKLQLDKYPPRSYIQLLEGDRLLTAQGGRAMVWLNSRAVLYVNEESEIRAVNLDDYTPHFEVLRGAAIVRLQTTDFIHKKMGIEISTPHGAATISADGTYRFDTDDVGTTIKVYAGALLLGVGEEARAKTALKIKENEVASLKSTAHSPQISRPAALPPDAFDNWIKLFRR